MARIRTVKPEYWTDERVGECSVSARLLFIACWNFADDHGGLDRSSKQLKAQAFPYDNIDCEPLVQELLNQRLLIEYEVGGKKYLHIKGFRTHQKVEKPARPRVPLYDENATTHRGLTEGSPTSNGLFSGREGKGMEKEGSKNPSASATPANGKNVSRESIDPDWWLDFKLVYPSRAGDQGWRKAQRAAHARLAEGCTPDQFIDGAKRYAAFCDSQGKTGSEYVKQACTFLGPDKPFLEPWTPAPNKAELKQNRNISASEQWLREQEANDAAH
jgi:hypothetical protein